ncbi:MAG: CsbD family protein [Actinobacteria bacterium]|nr:CsbD family protein [Actinomycetota bacterium]
MDDKAKGKAKEAFGAVTGDEAKKEEGRAQQRKADAEEEATQKEKTSQAKEEARQAERKRDRQKQKDEGLLGGLGGVTDSLSGRDRGSRS